MGTCWPSRRQWPACASSQICFWDETVAGPLQAVRSIKPVRRRDVAWQFDRPDSALTKDIDNNYSSPPACHVGLVCLLAPRQLIELTNMTGSPSRGERLRA